MRDGTVILILLAFLITGCANGHIGSDGMPHAEQVDSRATRESESPAGQYFPDEQPSIAVTAVAEESANESDDPPAAAGMEEDDAAGQAAGAEPLLILDEVPPLTLEPHESITRYNFYVRNAFPLNTPYYGEDFRLQVTRYDDNYVELAFGNTSDKPIVLSDDHLYFLLIGGAGEDLSKSTLVGSPVTIEPNTIETLKVTKVPRAVHFRFSYGNVSSVFRFPLKKEITDTEPLEQYLFEDLVAISSYGDLKGNGKLKFQVKNAMLTDNKVMEGIHVGEQGRIVLLNVQLANTSDEVLKIEKLTAVLNDFVNDVFPEHIPLSEASEEALAYHEHTELFTEEVDIPLSSLDWLGDLAFPAEVAPHTIVEGYFPAIMKDVNLVNNLVVETNLGTLALGGINNYSLW